ncbi:MAG: hypothetical protein AB4041_14045 [Microcystaceae cyanobacterium]
MFVETIETLSTGVGVVDISKSAFPTFKKLFKRIKEGKINIVIFGAGGCGKSTLGRLLSGQQDQMSLLSTYQESITTETYELETNTMGAIIVAAGQERRQDNWGELLQAVSDGKFKLIVHVVAAGLHSFGGGIPYQRHKLYQADMTIPEFIEVYRRNRLQREIEVLETLRPHLSVSKSNKIAMVTLVTKQDLWWTQREAMKTHYEQSNYDKLIQEITQQKGSQNFIHEYVSASLVLENLVSGAKEVLVPTTAGYDQPLKNANFKRMITILEQLSGADLGG